MADSLQAQLLARVATFQKHYPTITKADIARHCHIDEANFGAALSGRRGLSVDGILRLHTLLNTPHNQVLAKFRTPARSSQILQLQESFQGKPSRGMTLDNSGWYPFENGSGGKDPLNSTGIDNKPSADTTGPVWDQDLIDTLREARGYHRKIVRAINGFIQQAKVNAGITVPSGVAQKFGR